MNKKLLLTISMFAACIASMNAQTPTTDDIDVGVYTHGNRIYLQYPSQWSNNNDTVVFRIEEESDNVEGEVGRVALDFLDGLNYWNTFSSYYIQGNPYIISNFFNSNYFTSGKRYRLAYRLTPSFICTVEGHNPSYGSIVVDFSGGRDHNPPQVVIHETINLSLDPASIDERWIQKGTDSPYSEIHYTDWTEFSTTDGFYYYLISLTF